MTLQSEDMGKLVAGPDGWIEWSGGENPMPGQAVEVMFRDLYEVNAEDRARATRHSSNVSWKHWGTSSDIIAFRPAHREAHPEADGGGEAWMALTPDDQFALATRIAANVGYELTPEPEHPDSPHQSHPDDLAVDRFAAAMKAKLAKKRADGRGGWDDKAECSAEFLSKLLRGHVEKGDPLDVGNFAMMLHQRGEGIASAAPSDWSEHEDEISDAIGDSIDMDWTSRVGAQAVVRYLNSIGGAK